MKTKKHGWVVKSTGTGYFQAHTVEEVASGKETFYYGNKTLDSAHVFATRKLARVEKRNHERVLKVKVNKQGKAVKIIPGR